MRLTALFLVASVNVIAAPVIAAQVQVQPPPRDAVRRPEPTGTGRIRGRIVAADTGAPIRRASVNLSPLPPQAAGGRGALAGGVGDIVVTGRGSGVPPTQLPGPRQATTDADGSFEFAGLPAGRYRLMATAGQYAGQYLSLAYGARPGVNAWSDPSTPIELAEGQSFDKANIALPRGGVVTGRITDENGEPLSRVQVYTLAIPPGMGRAQRTGAGDTTDDLGQFRLFGLSANEYLIAAEARGNTFVSPNMRQETEEDRLGFVTTYYPGTPDEASAQRVRVKLGAETPGIEIRLAQARLFRVSGMVVDSQGKPLAGANGQLMRRGAVNGPGFFAFTDAKGQFQMRNIPAGDYRFTMRPQQIMVPGSPPSGETVEMASAALTIAGDVDNLLLTTSPGVAISGRVIFEQGPPTVGLNNMRVFATHLNPEDSGGLPTPPPATVGSDGTFTLKGLMGEYTLRASIPNQFTRKISLNGQDITDAGREFKSGDRVTITVTSRASTVEGNVSATRDGELSEAGIILFSEDKGAWRLNSMWTRRTGVDGNGHYRLQGIMPGRYYVAAVLRDRLNRGPAGVDAAFFEELAKEATAVVVGEEEQRTVDLRVLSGGQ